MSFSITDKTQTNQLNHYYIPTNQLQIKAKENSLLKNDQSNQKSFSLIGFIRSMNHLLQEMNQNLTFQCEINSNDTIIRLKNHTSCNDISYTYVNLPNELDANFVKEFFCALYEDGYSLKELETKLLKEITPEPTKKNEDEIIFNEEKSPINFSQPNKYCNFNLIEFVEEINTKLSDILGENLLAFRIKKEELCFHLGKGAFIIRINNGERISLKEFQDMLFYRLSLIFEIDEHELRNYCGFSKDLILSDPDFDKSLLKNCEYDIEEIIENINFLLITKFKSKPVTYSIKEDEIIFYIDKKVFFKAYPQKLASALFKNKLFSNLSRVLNIPFKEFKNEYKYQFKDKKKLDLKSKNEWLSFLQPNKFCDFNLFDVVEIFNTKLKNQLSGNLLSFGLFNDKLCFRLGNQKPFLTLFPESISLEQFLDCLIHNVSFYIKFDSETLHFFNNLSYDPFYRKCVYSNKIDFSLPNRYCDFNLIDLIDTVNLKLSDLLNEKITFRLFQDVLCLRFGINEPFLELKAEEIPQDEFLIYLFDSLSIFLNVSKEELMNRYQSISHDSIFVYYPDVNKPYIEESLLEKCKYDIIKIIDNVNFLLTTKYMSTPLLYQFKGDKISFKIEENKFKMCPLEMESASFEDELFFKLSSILDIDFEEFNTLYKYEFKKNDSQNSLVAIEDICFLHPNKFCDFNLELLIKIFNEEFKDKLEDRLISFGIFNEKLCFRLGMEQYFLKIKAKRFTLDQFLKLMFTKLSFLNLTSEDRNRINLLYIDKNHSINFSNPNKYCAFDLEGLMGTINFMLSDLLKENLITYKVIDNKLCFQLDTEPLMAIEAEENTQEVFLLYLFGNLSSILNIDQSQLEELYEMYRGSEWGYRFQ